MAAPYGLVLAAGRGHRFTAGGGEGHKSLAGVGGTSALLWTLGVLRDCGVTDAVVVLGHDADRLRAAVDAAPRRPRIAYLLSDAWERTDSAYSFGVGARRPGPVLLTYADVFLRPPLVRRLLAAGDRDLLTVDATRPRAAWDMDAHLVDGRLARIAKFLPAELGHGESACLYRFTDASRELLATAGRRTRDLPDRVQFERLLDGLLDRVDVRPVWCREDEWCEVDTPADLARAEQVLAAERAATGA